MRVIDIIVLLAITIRMIFGSITDKMNKEKGYDSGFWWGFFLGVIGIIVVAVRPYKK